MPLKRKILVGIAFALAGMLLSAFSFTGHAIAEPLRLGVLHAAHSALIYIADSQGFFKKRSVDLVMKEYEAGVTAVNDLIAGNLDAAIATGYVLVRQSFTHPDLRIAASICIASDMEIVVRRDRGIARPQDLKGKRVAVTRGAISEFFLYTYLLFNNIPAASVRVVYLAPSEIVKEMAAGTIDVALLWPPYTDEIVKGLVREGSPLASPERPGLLLQRYRKRRVFEDAAGSNRAVRGCPFGRRRVYRTQSGPGSLHPA